jgi:hypothetical protein
MSFVKYKEVYAAAAEVLGLILQYITERKHVSAALCTGDYDCPVSSLILLGTGGHLFLLTVLLLVGEWSM